MNRTRAGFTLIELMIVVVIIGILSAVAIPAFRTYVQRSKTTEAVTFLGEIKQRQEAYRAEYGQYCAVSGAAFGVWQPRMTPDANTAPWLSPNPWSSLGAQPDGPVRFVYGSIAGNPGTAGPAGTGITGDDFWFVSQAIGDIDGDGITCTFESYSASNNIWIGVGGVTSSAGWE